MKPLLTSVDLFICGGLLLAIFTAGCASDNVTLVPPPPIHAQKMGMVEGSSCGTLAIGSPPLSFIPVGLGGRMERAYNDALAKAPGATGLTNVTIQENWYWIVLGTLRTVTITGEAVK